jgi:hypothetical protein
MRKRQAFALICLIFLLHQTALGFVPPPTPALSGSTGVIRMPSADVIPYKNMSLGVDTGPVAFTDKWTFLYKINIGTFQGMELGFVGANDPIKDQLKDGVYINMKYCLVADTSPYPLLFAIGCENLTSQIQSDVYMIATRYLANGSRLHFGFIGDFVDPSIASNRFRPVGALGFDSPMLVERLYGLIDMFAGEHVFQLDIGIRWYVSDTTAINLSAVNILSDKNTPVDNYRDPKAVLIGFSWINPL